MPYQGSLDRYGSADFMLIVLKGIREKIGKDDGGIVKITLQEDIEPRVVLIPLDYQKLLDQEPAALIFYKNAPTLIKKNTYVGSKARKVKKPGKEG